MSQSDQTHKTTYRLHHIGLLCEDPNDSARFYNDVLQLETLARYASPDEFDLTFLAGGSDLLIELVGAPFSDGENAFLRQRGHALHHIAFETADVDLAFAQLTKSGLKVAWEPDTFEFVRHCAVFDNSGIVVEILQEMEPLPAVKPMASSPFRVHHASMLTRSWQETCAFYAEHFGMASPFQYVYDHGGAFAYLTDPIFDPISHNVMLEVIGPPYEEAREFAFAEAYGAGLDHLGLLVPDVSTAYQALTAKLSGKGIPPYSGYGTEMFWGKDRDGNDLEFMHPLPVDRLQEALASGKPYRPAN